MEFLIDFSKQTLKTSFSLLFGAVMISKVQNGQLADFTAIDEQTPLLASNAQHPINQTNDAEVIVDDEQRNDNLLHANGTSKSDEDEDRPLPMGQVFVLCLSRLVDPISFFCIFPFVPKMVERMDVREEDVGFYTGLIVGLRALYHNVANFHFRNHWHL